MITFFEWMKKQDEMVGTGVVYDGTKSPDFNYWGAPESMGKPYRLRKKKLKEGQEFDQGKFASSDKAKYQAEYERIQAELRAKLAAKVKASEDDFEKQFGHLRKKGQ